MKHLPIIASLALAGCSVTNTEADFLCRAQAGTPCATIAEADGQDGKDLTPVTETLEDLALKSLSQEPIGIGKTADIYASLPDGGYPYDSDRYRQPEVVGRLWIAPYLDQNELLHESRYVHFIVQDARWVQR